MGWFDNEQDGQQPNAAAPHQAPSRTVAKAAPAAAPESGSTLGRQIHVDGTIVCDEDLTILGRVDGTLRAKGTLVIAKEADVRAKIDGQRVLVHGKVNGNVHGAERVVLGQTARLTGNIEAPTLEIIEGAYFKGNVEMQAPKPAKKEAAPAAKPKFSAEKKAASDEDPASSEDTVAAGSDGDNGSAEDAEQPHLKPVAGPSADEASNAPKQATP